MGEETTAGTIYYFVISPPRTGGGAEKCQYASLARQTWINNEIGKQALAQDRTKMLKVKSLATILTGSGPANKSE